MTAPSRHAASATELKARIDAERRGAPFLVYRDADGIQRLESLGDAEDRLWIGRGDETDLPLPWDPEVSRLHAQLERAGARWTLVDDGVSRNGSFVNGERVAGRRRLADGDVLRFGHTEMLFRSPGDATATATALSEETALAAGISETQRKVLLALARPFRDGGAFAAPATNQQIANELYLSVGAVKTHLRALFGRFGIEDLPQNQKRLRLIELAFQSGLIGEHDLA